jgi:hypothetical protein
MSGPTADHRDLFQKAIRAFPSRIANLQGNELVQLTGRADWELDCKIVTFNCGSAEIASRFLFGLLLLTRI